jgi:hypothetical protein
MNFTQKATLRVATKDPYCYVEKEIIFDDVITPEDIKKRYDELYRLMNDTGYNDSNYLDDLIIIVKNNLNIEGADALEEYEGFSDKQKLVLKEIRNLVSRAISKYKPEK